MCAGALGSPNKALCGTSNTEWRFAGGWHCQRLRQPSWCCWAPVPKAQAAFGSMPGDSTTGAPDWRDAAKLRKFLADDIPQWTPSEGAENTRAFLAALREKCSTEIGAMTGLLLALFEERVDASKAGRVSAPCSVLFWPVLEHPQNRRVLSVLPPLTFFGRQATAGPRKGGAAGRRPGFLRGTASKPAEGAAKKIQKISEVASPTKYLLC